MMSKACDPVKIDTGNVKQILTNDLQWRELKDNLRKGGYSTNLSIREALHHKAKANRKQESPAKSQDNVNLFKMRSRASDSNIAEIVEAVVNGEPDAEKGNEQATKRCLWRVPRDSPEDDFRPPKMRSRDSSSSLVDFAEALITGGTGAEKGDERALGRRLWLVPQDSSSTIASSKCIYAELNNSFSTLNTASEDMDKMDDSRRRFDGLVRKMEDIKKPIESKSLGNLLSKSARKPSLDARIGEAIKDAAPTSGNGLSRLIRRMSLTTDTPILRTEQDIDVWKSNSPDLGELLETWNHDLRSGRTHTDNNLDQDCAAIVNEDTGDLLEDWNHDLRARKNR